jgi:hypothetical protein
MKTIENPTLFSKYAIVLLFLFMVSLYGCNTNDNIDNENIDSYLNSRLEIESVIEPI